MPFLSGGNENDWERGPPGDWPAFQQSGREFSLTVPKARASDVSLPAHAKSAEVRLHSFISTQSLQFGKAHQPENP